MSETVTLHRDYPAPPERVFEAFTNVDVTGAREHRDVWDRHRWWTAGFANLDAVFETS